MQVWRQHKDKWYPQCKNEYHQDGDQKFTKKKIMYKLNEGCPLMDMVVPKHEPLQNTSLSLRIANPWYLYPLLELMIHITFIHSPIPCTHTQLNQTPCRSSLWYEPSYASLRIGPNEIHKSSPCLSLVCLDSSCQILFWHQSSLLVH